MTYRFELAQVGLQVNVLLNDCKEKDYVTVTLGWQDSKSQVLISLCKFYLLFIKYFHE